MTEVKAKSSDQQSDPLDYLLDRDAKMGEGGGQESAQFEFVSMVEWPDELKPKVEQQYRRKRPIQGAWVMLGNDELWLIPEIEYLGKDIEVKHSRTLWGAIKVSFDATFKHHRQLRELLAKILVGQTGSVWDMLWDDAYMLMVLALRVNYKISDDELNRIGLLRQEHVADILVALTGSAKKNGSLAEPELPLPLTAVM